MKKLMMLLLSGVSVVVLSGCGGGGGDHYQDDLTTLFLVNEEGSPYPDIPYICDSMADWDFTLENGEFSFYPGEECTFDFTGLNGTDPDDGYTDHYIYIVDDLDNGKNEIDYYCLYFGVGTTYDDGMWDGSFDYYADDRCAFEL